MRFEDLSDPEYDARHHWVIVTGEGVVLFAFDDLEDAQDELVVQLQHEEREQPELLRVTLRIEERNAPKAQQ